jgi:hypothetical protein
VPTALAPFVQAVLLPEFVSQPSERLVPLGIGPRLGVHEADFEAVEAPLDVVRDELPVLVPLGRRVVRQPLTHVRSVFEACDPIERNVPDPSLLGVTAITGPRTASAPLSRGAPALFEDESHWTRSERYPTR